MNNKNIETLINNFEYIERFEPKIRKEIKKYIQQLQQETEKLHSYKPLYQSLKRQKEELRSWLEEKIQYIDTIYLGTDRKNYSDDTILDMSSRKWGYKDTLNKLEELEGVNSESKRDV